MGISGYLAARPFSTSVRSSSPLAEEAEEGEKEEVSSSDGLLPSRRRCQDSEEKAAEEVKESPIVTGLAVSFGYLLGGILLLFPYFFFGMENIHVGFAWSFGLCVVALFLLGFGKDFILTRNDKGVDEEDVGKRRVEKSCVGGCANGFAGECCCCGGGIVCQGF